MGGPSSGHNEALLALFPALLPLFLAMCALPSVESAVIHTRLGVMVNPLCSPVGLEYVSRVLEGLPCLPVKHLCGHCESGSLRLTESFPGSVITGGGFESFSVAGVGGGTGPGCIAPMAALRVRVVFLLGFIPSGGWLRSGSRSGTVLAFVPPSVLRPFSKGELPLVESTVAPSRYGLTVTPSSACEA